MVEKAKTIAPNAPVGAPKSRPDRWEDSFPEPNELRERLPASALMDRSGQAIDLGSFHALGSPGAVQRVGAWPPARPRPWAKRRVLLPGCYQTSTGMSDGRAAAAPGGRESS